MRLGRCARVAAALMVGAFSAVGNVERAAAQSTAPTASSAAPTFSGDVAAILYEKCVSCHRDGEVAPMSLITYQEVRPWVRSIRAKVDSGEMPPWHADPEHGSFRNDRRLTPEEIQTLVGWADAGAPLGNSAEVPPVPDFAEGWQIGTPEMVFEMPVDFEIPGSGEIEYQYFEVPTNFSEDRWMQAGEARAGDRAHVHHIIVYVIEPPGNARPNVMSVRAIPPATAAERPAAPPARRQLTREQLQQLAQTSRRLGGNMLVNWAVGEDAPVHEPGTAKRIPAGSTLLFQVHYTTNGTPGLDRSKVGLIFADAPPAREIRTGMIVNAGFAIPPGNGNYEVAAEATFTDDVNIWSLHPHMHYRGKDMTYTAQYPDGREEILLRVPRYDFGWQTDYWLAEPIRLPAGTKVQVEAHFDNSLANPYNPDANDTVRWGDQTWEEMMIGFFTYTVEGAQADAPAASSTGADAGWTTPRTPWGVPDLQGTWTSQAELGVPFERSAQFGDRDLLTDEEFAEREARAQSQLDTDNADFDLETSDRSNAGAVGSATSPPPHWLERGDASRRTSLVIDPPDGRLPTLSAEGRARLLAQPLGSFSLGRGRPLEGPEDFRWWDRCITIGTPGAMFPTVYNANTRLVQGPGFVAITNEMVHDTRIVPIVGTDAAPLSPAIRQYAGASRGHWDGDTLVVEVGNFNGKVSYRGSGDQLQLTERFTRVSDGVLRYEVTVRDPTSWDRPWTAALNLAAQADELYEYACHEGNYGLRNMLAAARAED